MNHLIIKKYTPKSPCLTQGSQEKPMKIRFLVRAAGATAFIAVLTAIASFVPAAAESATADEADDDYSNLPF